jgi:hypothetical protein
MISLKEFGRKWLWLNGGTIWAAVWRTEENHESKNS